MMEESQREEVMRIYEVSMPVEFGACSASLWKRVEERERKRKSELLKEGVRRIFFHEGSGPNGVFDFGKYEGQTFAAVYMKERSYAEWTLKQDKCRKWKLKCFKFFLRSLSDLERVLKREREPEEMARVTRVECLAEEMAQEQMRVLEEHRVRWADMDEDSEMER